MPGEYDTRPPTDIQGCIYQLIEMQASLKAGNRAFEEQRRKNEQLEGQLAVVRDRIQPKAFDWRWAVGIALVVVGHTVAVTSAFNERPKAAEVAKLIADQPIAATAADVKTLQNQVGELQRQIDRLVERANRNEQDIAKLQGSTAAAVAMPSAVRRPRR